MGKGQEVNDDFHLELCVKTGEANHDFFKLEVYILLTW